jgi:RimJ/RimL family protein N-acetyltransferase
MYEYDTVILRKVEEDDLPFLKKIKDDTWESTHRTAVLNGLDQQRWFESLDSSPSNPRNLILVADHVDGYLKSPPIGIFKINNVDYINGSADVGWDIHPSHRKKGYGKRLVRAGCNFCFDVLALRRLNAEILMNNVPSLKCAAAAGFIQEGRKRAAVIKCGEAIDSVVVGLLVYERVK